MIRVNIKIGAWLSNLVREFSVIVVRTTRFDLRKYVLYELYKTRGHVTDRPCGNTPASTHISTNIIKKHRRRTMIFLLVQIQLYRIGM